MITTSLSNRYKVDPYGTEEILSDASVSAAPKLTIDYGDEVQEAEFTIRPTKGSLDTNISPVAILNDIKGNTIAWNQLLYNGDFSSVSTFTFSNCTYSVSDNIATVTPIPSSEYFTLLEYTPILESHKYLIKCDLKKSTSSSLIRFELRDNKGVIRVAIASNTTDWQYLSGITTARSTNNSGYVRLYAEGDAYQAKNFMLFDLTSIYGSGNEPSTAAQFEADYYKWFGKPLSYEDYDTGSLRNCKMSGIKTTDGDSNLLCINPIPVTSLKGKLNGEGNSIVVFSDGIKSAGDVWDEIKVEDNILKGIKRVDTRAYESGDVNSSTMTTDGTNYTNYALATPEEYIIDDVSVEKIMLGSTEVTKVYLGNQLIFEYLNINIQ